MHLPDPTFPPLLTGHAVSALQHPFSVAVAGARTGELSAGDLVWSRNARRMECAIVLEPDVPRARVFEILYVATVAFGDAFGAIAPSEVAMTWRWPQTVCVNGAVAGRLPFAFAPDDGADGAPVWAVVGAELALRGDPSDPAPGLNPDRTTLDEEGCGEVDRTQLIESFSRHFLARVDGWEHDGFRHVHDDWLFRADRYREDMEIVHGGERLRGTFLGLDEAGNLLLKTQAGTRALSIAEAVSAQAGAQP